MAGNCISSILRTGLRSLQSSGLDKEDSNNMEMNIEKERYLERMIATEIQLENIRQVLKDLTRRVRYLECRGDGDDLK